MRTVSTRLGEQVILGDLEDPDLLLWPGVLFGAELHEPLAQCLRERGFGVALVEAPGFGGGTLDRETFSMEDCGAAFLEVADALGVEHPVLGGTSWGGTSAMHAARCAPERVRGVVAMNAPFHRGDQSGFFSRLHLVVRTVPAGLFALGSIRTSLGRRAQRERGLAMARILRGSLKSARPVDRSAVARMVFRERDALFPALPGIDVPTLVVHGDEDSLCTLRGAVKAADLLPRASLEVIPGAGHLAAWERPVAVANAVDAFLRELRRPG